MLFTDESRGRPFAKDPAVVKLGGRYLLYYTVPPMWDRNEGMPLALRNPQIWSTGRTGAI